MIQNVNLEELLNPMSIEIENLDVELKIKNSRIKCLKSELEKLAKCFIVSFWEKDFVNEMVLLRMPSQNNQKT